MNANVLYIVTIDIFYIYIYLLYKGEKLSVRPSVGTFFVTLITLPSRDVSTPDLLEMKATSSGINKFVFKSFYLLPFAVHGALNDGV